ncbi:unnamed protein product [Cyprideis torosa]|uniref:Isochorismatase-like domain-containing protein n=1 Tax=Cyprideis torosa TaxID=163714 RepID=A0A7R8WMZ2_9CRUS|nr:unnamed protein product [Cyprideis torosa]CAG0899809.1 unnamed protein product [Cyprideis torosa]
MASRGILRLAPKTTALLLCDMQEKFRGTVRFFPEIVAMSHRMLMASQELKMPVLVTEQYPKGLGRTVAELGLDDTGITPMEKTQFSMCIEPILKGLKERNVQNVILCGIESHACIQQTALDLLDEGYGVCVVVDACSSRSMADRTFAFRRMEKAGAVLSTSEAVILELVRDAKAPQFKNLQKLIMEQAPDCGLAAP